MCPNLAHRPPREGHHQTAKGAAVFPQGLICCVLISSGYPVLVVQGGTAIRPAGRWPSLAESFDRDPQEQEPSPLRQERVPGACAMSRKILMIPPAKVACCLGLFRVASAAYPLVSLGAQGHQLNPGPGLLECQPHNNAHLVNSKPPLERAFTLSLNTTCMLHQHLECWLCTLSLSMT